LPRILGEGRDTHPRSICIRGELVRETPESYLWKSEEGDDYWIPKKQILDECDGEVYVTKWFAEQIEYTIQS
jgi:hypothetical protein